MSELLEPVVIYAQRYNTEFRTYIDYFKDQQ